jgi:multiple sugar transport system permease protein
MTRRHLINGLLFISPWIVGVCLFIGYPIGASFYYSFTDTSMLGGGSWVGWQNYVTLLTADPLFWTSLGNTLFFAALSVPLTLLLSLALAILLSAQLREVTLYRTILYLPTLMPAVAVALLWLWMLNPDNGLVNAAIGALGLPTPGWLTDPSWAKPALVLVSLWTIGSPLVIYLAGIKDIPEEVMEAAALDGASRWQRVRHITVPLVTPMTFFNLIIGLIGAFQYFTIPFIMTVNASTGLGSPLDSTLFYSVYLYSKAFRDVQAGYASAMAWLLFLIIMGLTLALFRSSARWVYYAGHAEQA